LVVSTLHSITSSFLEPLDLFSNTSVCLAHNPGRMISVGKRSETLGWQPTTFDREGVAGDSLQVRAGHAARSNRDSYYFFLSTGGATSTTTPGRGFFFVAGAISLIAVPGLFLRAGAISWMTPRADLAREGEISGATSTITSEGGLFGFVMGATSVTREPAFFFGGATSTIGLPFGFLPGAISTTGPYGFFLGGATSTITPGFFGFVGLFGRFFAILILLISGC
jgi:hypothetical protein